MRLKQAALLLLVLFVGAQFFRPSTAVPPVDSALGLAARTQMPPHLSGLLERSCRDCHSHDSTWPWYSKVAPVSWWIAGHVNDGRRHFNYSTWGSLEPAKASHALEEVCEVVEEGEMPPASYLFVHREVRLSKEEAGALCQWTRVERERIAPSVPVAR